MRPKTSTLDIPVHYVCQTRKGVGKKWCDHDRIIANDEGKRTAVLWLLDQPNPTNARVLYGKHSITVTIK